MRIEPEIKNIMKKIEQLSSRHGYWETFSDWISCMALAISNVVDGIHYEIREKEYLQIIKKYSSSEQEQFAQMFAMLQQVIEKRQIEGSYEEILGFIHHDMKLNNENVGQFFTPWSICQMMGRVTVDQSAKETVKEKGFVSLAEPSCGAGATILGCIEALAKIGVHPGQALVKGTDIDLRCVQMTYVQLSLYAVPAVIKHGNTLSMNEWSNWYTPAYMLGAWYWKDDVIDGQRQYQEIEIFKRVSNPLYAAIRTIEEGNLERKTPEKEAVSNKKQ